MESSSNLLHAIKDIVRSVKRSTSIINVSICQDTPVIGVLTIKKDILTSWDLYMRMVMWIKMKEE